MNCRSVVTTLAVLVNLSVCQAGFAQVLHSWEGSTETWTTQNGASIANTAGGPNDGIGVTDGTDSLAVTVPNDGFLRWGSGVLDLPELVAVTDAAINPLIHKLEFDVTYDTSLIPQGSVTFINHQMAIQTDQGWSQIDFATRTDGQTNETITYSASLSKFSTINELNTSIEILMAINSDWVLRPEPFSTITWPLPRSSPTWTWTWTSIPTTGESSSEHT